MPNCTEDSSNVARRQKDDESGEANADDESIPMVPVLEKPIVISSAGPRIRKHDKDLDSGWAWVVLAAMFTAIFVGQGQAFITNIYFVIYLEVFQQPRAITALPGAITTAVMYLIGPLTSYLLLKTGARRMLIAAGLFNAIGFLCLSTAQSITEIVIFNSIFRGISAGLLGAATLAALAQYFKKRLYMATGIMYSATTLGMMVIGILTEYGVEYYGWRGFFYLQCGMTLQICVCGALIFRRPARSSRGVTAAAEENETSITYSTPSSRVPSVNYLIDLRFWCISTSSTFFIMYTSILMILWKDILLIKEAFKVAVTAMAIGNTLGRATSGLVSKRFAPPLHNAAVGIGNSVVIPAFLVADKVWLIAIHSFAWGFLNGQQTVADRLQIAWVYGRKKLPTVYGYSLALVTVGGFVAPSLGALLADLTSDYTLTVILAASFSATSAISSFLLYVLHKKRLQTNENNKCGTLADQEIFKN